MKPSIPETVMKKAQKLFEKSGMTLEELGLKMGNEKRTARQAAWQFLNKTSDPRLSMLCRFAGAMGIEPSEFFSK